jgi:hypothetical protein
MALRDWIAAAAGGLTLIIMAMGAQAFPFTYSTVEFKAAARETSNVDKAASRHCWWRNGRQHCRSYESPHVSGNRKGHSDNYVDDSREIPVGSQRWWQQKEMGGGGGGGM